MTNMDSIVKNRYKIIRKIGSGGMADVYLAFDLVLEREVALKVLRGALAQDPVALLRFEREAQAVSGLVHENIVEVYDVVSEHNQHFIVMEYVKGHTLKEWIHKRGALDYKEAVYILKQIVSGLQAAHEKQIIHRDIKPQNVLIKADGTVRITDFGIALAGDALQLTKSDSVLGSVHYLAPECSRGEGATTQADIYSLGIVFYELLTGTLPFSGENAVEIAMKHMKEDLPNIQDINPTIPNSVVNIVRKATQKNKANRYLSTYQITQDLEGCLLEENLQVELWEPDDANDEGTKVIKKLDTVSEEGKKKRQKKIIMYSLIGVVALLIPILYFILRPSPVVMHKIPLNLVGKPIDEVTVALEEAGITIDPNFIYEFSEEYEKDVVMKLDPKSGTEVEEGTPVKLTVSQGKTLKIIDFSGMSVDEVIDFLKGYNVSIKETKIVDDKVEIDRVVKQERLMPGDMINLDSSYYLTLYISDYNSGVVPGVKGLSIAEATAILDEMNFKYVLEKNVIEYDKLNSTDIANLKYDVVTDVSPGVGNYYVQTKDNVITLYYNDSKDKPTQPQQPITPEKPTTPEEENPSDNSDGDTSQQNQDEEGNS